jgi:hypothetical protein
MIQPKPIADLIGVLKDLLAMPEFDSTQQTSQLRRSIKRRARDLIDEYEKLAKPMPDKII